MKKDVWRAGHVTITVVLKKGIPHHFFWLLAIKYDFSMRRIQKTLRRKKNVYTFSVWKHHHKRLIRDITSHPQVTAVYRHKNKTPSKKKRRSRKLLGAPTARRSLFTYHV